MNLQDAWKQIFQDKLMKIVMSNKLDKAFEFDKIVISLKINKEKFFYQIEKYTKTQVFHENIDPDFLQKRVEKLFTGNYKQFNGFGEQTEYIILGSKKGNVGFKKKVHHTKFKIGGHDKEKQYILQEGIAIPPLVDMGIFTKDGEVVKSKFDKYKQINRYLEIIDDAVRESNLSEIRIIDFGCGKSYLTFVLYYYLTYIKGMNANIIGLDLKKEVISKCNQAAKKYGYSGLEFRVGDIADFVAREPVDMVISLHACDTATDYAIYNAIKWKAKMIFCVPCCQHELNAQMQNNNIFKEYGLIQERFASLATDAIRGKMMEYCGYKTQILEFIDTSHTPKNLLIRGVRKGINSKERVKSSRKMVEDTMKEYGVHPKIYDLIMREED